MRRKNRSECAGLSSAIETEGNCMQVTLSEAAVLLTLLLGTATAQSAALSVIAPAKDKAFPGEMQLAVDLSDTDRRIVQVHERLSGVDASTVLLYPKWLPGDHEPDGPIDKLAGLRITANGAPVAWTRDPLDVYAFHVHVPAGIKAIDVDFQYLSATSAKVGNLEISPDLLLLEWNNVVLYPAGYFVSRIPVDARVTVPLHWKFGSSLEVRSSGGAETSFKRVSLETLIDSPLYAGRYSQRLDLDPNAAAAVYIDLFADRAELLSVKPEQLAAYRALVQQAYKLFASHHYAHYDFLYSLSDQVEQNGLEHHQSSEDGTAPESFTEWDKHAWERDLLAHEFTHSWNGKFRRPADLWTPNYTVPMQDSLLWVYEGQTEYWGGVLAARSGLWSLRQALEQLAVTAGYFEIQSGRGWRALQDTTNDPVITPRHPLSWRDYQRSEDYYREGLMIWLDADTLIREQSKDMRSLDDFAKAFFGINDGKVDTVTYTFEDVLTALNSVQPYDWRTFLRSRLDSSGKPPFEDGLRRGGYKLVYTDTPNDMQKSSDDVRKRDNFFFSIGVEVDSKESTVVAVIWDSAAFKAKLTEGMQILAVNGTAYTADVLKDAIRSAKSAQSPLELIVKNGDRFRVINIDYQEGLRYPHLERDPNTPPRLDTILTAR
jgi:predicted metalloprotease with PDZ domain